MISYLRNARRPSPSARMPRFTRGDVLATMEPDTWISMIAGPYAKPFYYIMWAAFAALAACARVAPFSAVRFTLKQYDDGELSVRNATGPSYPVVLLPVAIAAIERYLELRRPLGGTMLFVSETGKPFRDSDVPRQFLQLAKRHGLPEEGLQEALYAFFDRCFVHETDKAAVIALRHFRMHTERDVPRAAINAASRDHDRLYKVLRRNHKLSGEPGKWLRGHGKAKIAREMRLFKPIRQNKVSEFMRNDEVCAKLLEIDWSGSWNDMERLRRALVEGHLPCLSSLAERGLLTNRQIGHLLNCVPGVVSRFRRELRRSRETPDEKDARERLERHWDERLPAMYQTCPPRRDRQSVLRTDMPAGNRVSVRLDQSAENAEKCRHCDGTVHDRTYEGFATQLAKSRKNEGHGGEEMEEWGGIRRVGNVRNVVNWYWKT